MKTNTTTTPNTRNLFVMSVITLIAFSCQKELPVPDDPLLKPLTTLVKNTNDTFKIRAFYGHQGIEPPGVGTVIFPQFGYEVPAVNKLAFMSAYTGLNGYGDSANTTKKNAINTYNKEFYNNNVNAQGNAWVTLTPLNRPVPDYSSVSSDRNLAYDRFFSRPKQILISIKLVNGVWEYRDTATDSHITIHQMDKLNLVATESVETGLATKNGVQKLKNGQSETYLTFVNQRSFILQPSKTPEDKMLIWYPHLFR